MGPFRKIFAASPIKFRSEAHNTPPYQSNDSVFHPEQSLYLDCDPVAPILQVEFYCGTLAPLIRLGYHRPGGPPALSSEQKQYLIGVKDALDASWCPEKVRSDSRLSMLLKWINLPAMFGLSVSSYFFG